MTGQFLEFEKAGSCPGYGPAAIKALSEPEIGECCTCALLPRNPRPTLMEIVRSCETANLFAAWQEERNAA